MPWICHNGVKSEFWPRRHTHVDLHLHAVETMGLEPTTPCLQTRISPIHSDADGLKVLVRALQPDVRTPSDLLGCSLNVPSMFTSSQFRQLYCYFLGPSWRGFSHREHPRRSPHTGARLEPGRRQSAGRRSRHLTLRARDQATRSRGAGASTATWVSHTRPTTD